MSSLLIEAELTIYTPELDYNIPSIDVEKNRGCGEVTVFSTALFQHSLATHKKTLDVKIWVTRHYYIGTVASGSGK